MTFSTKVNVAVAVLIAAIAALIVGGGTPAASSAEIDPGLIQRVKAATTVFVATGVLVRKQHPSHVPLGFTACRFQGSRALKGKFDQGLRYLDTGLTGFTNDKQQQYAFDKERIVFVEQGRVQAKGNQRADIEAALIPATKETLAAVVAALRETGDSLPQNATAIEIAYTGSWGRGLVWSMEVTQDGSVLYREFTKKDARDPEEKPQETLRLTGAIPQKEAVELREFLEAPGLKEIPAEDAGVIRYTYRTASIDFTDHISAVGTRRNEPNVAKAIAERVDGIKAKLRPVNPAGK